MPPIAERGPALPSDARPYRHLGPFDASAIPVGLWRRHALKAGVWGLLSIESGSIRFCWDDDQGGARILSAGETMVIPPEAPHHLEPEGPVTIGLSFWAAGETTLA